MNPVSLSESLKIVRAHAERLKRSTEKVPTRSALHRVTATAMHACRSNPSSALAAMDGIAIDFRSAMETPARIGPQDWQKISTGEPVPDRFNAVVKIEDVKWEDQFAIVETPPRFFQHIRTPGEDFDEATLLFAAGHLLQSQDLSLLLSAGFQEVKVLCKPVVAFLPTGSELMVDPSDHKEGAVLESNSAMISGMVDAWGGILHIARPVADDLQQ